MVRHQRPLRRIDATGSRFDQASAVGGSVGKAARPSLKIEPPT